MPNSGHRFVHVQLGFASAQAADIVHDAEYYILEAQNGAVWAVEDGKLDEKIAELREKYGRPPNLIHYMWDDQPVMAFGDPIYQQIRGYSTPNLNQLADDGMLFSRMYSDPGEMHDLSPGHPDVVEAMAAAWENYAEANGVIIPSEPTFFAKPIKGRKF